MSQNTTLADIFQLFKQGTLKMSPEGQKVAQKGGCGCKKRKKEKGDELKYYESQKQMIIKVSNILNEGGRRQEQRVMGKILVLSIDFLNKIVEFLNEDDECRCRKQMLEENSVLKHKVQFLREENSKFFKLFESKNNQYEELKKKYQTIDFSKIADSKVLVPVMNLNNNENKRIGLLLKNQSMKQIESLRSSKMSKISEVNETFQASIQENQILDHSSYFGECSLKKQKKSRIFQV